MKRTLVIVLAGVALLAACDRVADIAGGETPAESRIAGMPLRQVDRFGLPAIATVFIPTDEKDAYNAAVPSEDRATYTDEVVGVLMAFGHSEASANALAAAVLPDVQPIDLSLPSGFLNGRRPQDDVITAELMLIFGDNAALNDDHVDANDRPFSTTFPYLAPPALQ